MVGQGVGEVAGTAGTKDGCLVAARIPPFAGSTNRWKVSHGRGPIAPAVRRRARVLAGLPALRPLLLPCARFLRAGKQQKGGFYVS